VGHRRGDRKTRLHPRDLHQSQGKPGLASAKAWSARDADEIARHCVGAAILGMPRWRFKDGNDQPVLLPTEFNHYEGALVRTLGLPTLVLVQRRCSAGWSSTAASAATWGSLPPMPT
jgi:hypothetical protein